VPCAACATVMLPVADAMRGELKTAKQTMCAEKGEARDTFTCAAHGRTRCVCCRFAAVSWIELLLRVCSAHTKSACAFSVRAC
jgi:hypothetical protein